MTNDDALWIELGEVAPNSLCRRDGWGYMASQVDKTIEFFIVGEHTGNACWRSGAVGRVLLAYSRSDPTYIALHALLVKARLFGYEIIGWPPFNE